MNVHTQPATKHPSTSSWSAHPAPPQAKLTFSEHSAMTYSVSEAAVALRSTLQLIAAQRERSTHTPCQEPILYLAGTPGVGKTKLIRTAAREEGFALFTLIAAGMNPEDPTGIPVVTRGANGEYVTYSPSVIIKEVETLRKQSGKPVVLFFDEASRIQHDVQAPLLSFVQFRGIHGHWLPEDTVIVMAGNREDDDGGGVALLAPLVNRVVMIDIAADPVDWVRWAMSAPEEAFPTPLHDLIAATLIKWPSATTSPFNFDPSEGAKPFGSPRSWEAVNDYIVYCETNGLEADLRYISGLVGRENAAVLSAQAKFAEKLIDEDVIFADPTGDKAIVHDEPTVAAMQLLRLARRVENKAHVFAACTYAMRPDPANPKSTTARWTALLGVFGDALFARLANPKRSLGLKDNTIVSDTASPYREFITKYAVGGAGVSRRGKKLL